MPLHVVCPAAPRSAAACTGTNTCARGGLAPTPPMLASACRWLPRLHRPRDAPRALAGAVHAARRDAEVDLGLPREAMRSTVSVTVHSCALRVAFSHLNLHRLVRGHAPILLKALEASAPADGSGGPSQGNGLAPRAPSAGSDSCGGERGGERAKRGDAFAATPAFRRSFNAVQLSVRDASAWLCNDGPHSFGAPDVLHVRSAAVV